MPRKPHKPRRKHEFSLGVHLGPPFPELDRMVRESYEWAESERCRRAECPPIPHKLPSDEELRRLYVHECWSVELIEAEFNVKHRTVLDGFRRAGIPLRPQVSKKRSQSTAG